MRLNFHLLHAFYVFSRSPNMIVAAETLGVSQPMLSIYLRQLEEEMPQQIFEIVGRKKTLTNFGRHLAQAVQQRFDGLPELVTTLALPFANEENSHLRIAGHRSVLRRIAHGLEFRGTLEFLIGDSRQAVDWLVQGKADLALSSYVPETHELAARPAFADEYVILYPSSWRLPAETPTKATLAELRKRPYFTYTTAEPLAGVVAGLPFDEPPRPQMILADWLIVFELLRLGRGWSIAPDSYAKDEDGLAVMRLPRTLRTGTQYHIITRQSDRQIEWLRKCVEKIRTVFK